MILASALVLSACGSKGGQQTAESVTSGATAVSFSGTGTIEDTILVDEKNVKITADNLTYSAYQTTMDLLSENNSDQDLSVISGSIWFQVKTSDYQDYLTTDPVKIKTSAATSYDLSEDTYQKAISDGTFEAVSGKKITAFQIGDYFSSGGIHPCFRRIGEQRRHQSSAAWAGKYRRSGAVFLHR